MACDTAGPMIRKMISDKIRPEFNEYKFLLPILGIIKNLLLILSIQFIIFGRPEWCVKKGDTINFLCTKSLDPQDEVTYDRVSVIPVLSDKTKMVICLMTQIVILIISLVRIKITRSSKRERNMFYCMLTIFLLYSTIYFINS